VSQRGKPWEKHQEKAMHVNSSSQGTIVCNIEENEEIDIGFSAIIDFKCNFGILLWYK